MTHPNEDLVRKGFAAFQSGDVAGAGELFADDIVWHVPGKAKLSGEHRGKAEVMTFFQQTFELTGGTFRLDVHDVLANDTHAVALVRATGDREGRHLDVNTVQVFELRDGEVTEAWLHPSDQYAADAFWA